MKKIFCKHSVNPRTPSPLMGEGRGEGEQRQLTPHPILLPQGEKGLLSVVLFLVLITAGNFAAFAQNNSGTAPQNSAQKPAMPLPVKKGFEKRKAELETMLADFHAGKYSDIQGHAILVQILFACGQLKEKSSSDCQSALKEYQNLNKSHPEFQNPPEFHKKYPSSTASDLLNIELPSQKAAREAEEKKKQEVQEKAKTWTPEDNEQLGYYKHENKLAVVYQYRIEFFNLKPSEIEPSGRVSISKISEKPHKIITFQEVIRAAPVIWFEATGPSIAVCTEPKQGYLARTEAEQAIIGRDPVSWHNPRGKFHDFCGVINVDGTIAAQMPRPWNLPIYKPLGISSDGKEALFGVGHWGMIKEDSDNPNFVCQYFIRWSYPNKIEKIETQKLTENQFNAIVQKFGNVNAWPPYDEVK